MPTRVVVATPKASTDEEIRNSRREAAGQRINAEARNHGRYYNQRKVDYHDLRQ